MSLTRCSIGYVFLAVPCSLSTIISTHLGLLPCSHPQHVYQKWNERLFREMYTAYKMGRTEKDPSKGWYEGELSFFDNYVIPLAKKLETCGVFGVSSDEYLNYAVQNRSEWENRGQDVVREMLARLEAR
jgi:hypothetical protein